jgi:para-nitrobenzyl esterase
MYQHNFADRVPPVLDEDCLYLNVWTPEPASGIGLPVMLWLHGGGNRYGYGSQDINNGAGIASRGVVVVTMNYRLGALGFLAHPGLSIVDGGASGNYALLDVIAALEWVREHISGFGGDPDRVTLAGNSAGAAIVCHLMAAPPARGLFRAALGQSASGTGRAEGPLRPLSGAETSGVGYATELGASTVDDLRALPATVLARRGHFGPIVDGRVLPRDTGAVFEAGAQVAVPLLVGSNLDEGSVYATGRDFDPGSELAALYPSGDPTALRRYLGDTRFVYPVWRWARTHRANSGAPVWQYRFRYAPEVPGDAGVAVPPDGLPLYGAFHTAELRYALDNLGPWRFSERDRQLAGAMAGAWARFVTDLDPAGGAVPRWPQVTAADDTPVLVLDENGRAAPDRFDGSATMRALDRLPRPL